MLLVIAPLDSCPSQRVYVCLYQFHLVAANAAYSGDMGGVSGADHACYRQARQAGMRSTFRAFIAGRVQDLHSIIHRQHDRQLPVVNAKVNRKRIQSTDREIAQLSVLYLDNENIHFVKIFFYCTSLW